MTKLILHIGSPKTGTSHIQKILVRNGRQLGESGISYLGCAKWHDGAHHILSFALRGLAYAGVKYDMEEVMSAVEREVRECGSRSIIISSELLFYDVSRDLTRLEKLLGLFEGVRVVVYLRDPVSYYNSMYKQMVKDPNDALALSPGDYLKSALSGDSYKDVVDSYCSIASEMDIYKYEDAGDVADHFFRSVLGVGVPENNIPGRSNESMDGQALKLKLYVNRFVRDYKNNKEMTKAINDFARKERLSLKRLNVFSREQCDRIIEYHEMRNSGLGVDFAFPEAGEAFLPVSKELLDRFIVYLKKIERTDLVGLLNVR